MMPRMKQILRWGGIVLATIICALLLALVIFRESGRRQVEAEIAKIRAAGEPVTWEELDRWYVEPPPGQNAAAIYTQAFANLVDQKNATNLPVVGLANLPELGEPLSAEMKAAIADCLQTNAAALELLHQAAGLHECRYPVDLLKGFATLLPHVPKARSAARILTLQAISSAEEGRADQVLRALLDGLAVASSFRQEPILISRLAGITINGLMVSGLEQSINRVAFSDAQLEELMTALADAERAPGMARTMAGDRASGSGMFERIRTGRLQFQELFGEDYTQHRALLINSYRVGGRTEHEETYYLRLMGDYLSAVRQPLQKRVPTAEAVSERLDSIPRFYMLCQLLLPVWDLAIKKDVQCLAQLEVARTALVVQRYRLANGKLPAALAELMPTYLEAVPVDPFDGQPLKFKPLAAGFVVYSIGRDSVDNGGRAKNDEGRQFQDGTDITFTVVR